MKRLVLLVVLMGAVGMPAALADVVHLKDGTNLEGDVKRNDDGWIVYANGVATKVRGDQVLSIELKPSAATGPQVAAERLASLRRSVENLTDLKEILSRYQRFIAQTNDAASVTEAKKDLAVWQDRLDRKMVKVGSKWILPADRAKLIGQSAALADHARQLMKQGRTKEADPLLAEAIADDPQNPSALYLFGLLRYQQDQIPAARKALDAVAAIVPNHAPTLNNLAVVQWRQRQFVAALASYDAAMLADPVSKDILDNVASALASLPAEFRNSPVTQKTARRFQEQDKTLQERMAQAGWHRYGTTWVTDKDMAQIKQQEKETQDKLDVLATAFDQSKERLDHIDRGIEDTESALHRIEATTYSRDPNTGAFIQLPYPSNYYDLQRDDLRMHQDRAKEVGKLDSLKQSALALRKRLPSQKAADVQKVIGPEGTPLRVTEAPATQPATQPNQAG
jgi:tetratricopeptide (TPR) repeat protein